jgi:hypothetical protein
MCLSVSPIGETGRAELIYVPPVNSRDIELTLMPPTSVGEYSILAVVKAPKDGEETWQLAGRLDVLSRTPKTYSVTLVPLATGHTIDKTAVSQYLNSTWEKYGISWTVDVDNEFYVDAQGVDGAERKEYLDYKLSEEWSKDDKWLTEYKPEQIAINRSYNTYASSLNKYDNTRMYVFILPPGNAPYENQIGDMPLGEQWGYLFVDNFGSSHYRTLSHELGHGRTALHHTFIDQERIGMGTTNNLMDYSTGTDLVRAQWDMIHKPAIFKQLQSDEDGAAIIPLLWEKGVVKIYAKCIQNCDNSGEIGNAPVYQYSKEFNIESLENAFKISEKTEIFKQTLNLLNDKKHTLQFMEFNYVNTNTLAFIERYLMDINKKGNRNLRFSSWLPKYISSFSNAIRKSPNNYYFMLRVSINPLILSSDNKSKNEAKLALALGHELFIHDTNIEALKLFKEGKYEECFQKCYTDSDLNGKAGDKDHQQYIRGNKELMNVFKNQLRQVIGKDLFDEIIKEHDKMYDYLK